MNEPAVSFLLMSYNQQDYIVEAVQGALSQSYKNIEIILSDDCSHDQTFERMQRIASSYTGPHKLIVNRNTRNLGLSAHVNWMIGASSGDYFVLAAGDDVSLPDRAKKSVAFLIDHPDVFLVSMGFQTIDKTGRVIKANESTTTRHLDLDSYFTKRPFHPNGASRTYRRLVYDKFGPLNAACPTEDTTLLLRAMMLGEVVDIPDTGIMYRRHGENLSTGENIAKMNLQRILDQYLADIAVARKSGIHDAARQIQLEEMVDHYIKQRVEASSVRKSSNSLFRRLSRRLKNLAKI